MKVIDRNIRSGDKAIDEYIEFLEESLLSFETSNIKRLIISADNIAGKLADDLDNISRGINTGFHLISDDKDDKKLDRVMSVVGKVKEFISISDSANQILPKIKEEQVIEEQKAIDTKKRLNAFEKVIMEKSK